MFQTTFKNRSETLCLWYVLFSLILMAAKNWVCTALISKQNYPDILSLLIRYKFWKFVLFLCPPHCWKLKTHQPDLTRQNYPQKYEVLSFSPVTKLQSTQLTNLVKGKKAWTDENTHENMYSLPNLVAH